MRVSMSARLLAFNVVVDAPVQCALVLAVAIETGVKVVDVDRRIRAERSNVFLTFSS